MKMNYLHGNDIKRKRFFTPFVFLLLLLIILLLFLLPIKPFFLSSLGSLGYPIWKAKASLSEKLFLGALIKTRISLVAENQSLREDLLAAELKAKENEILKEELKILQPFFKETSSEFYSLVLAKPPQTPYDTLIIDIGQSNFKGGERVFFESVLLGEITEILGRTAKVRLYSSGGVETKASIGRIGISVTAVGKGGGNFESRVHDEAEIEKGDFVIAADMVGKFLGQVEGVEENPTSAFKLIFFRFPLSISDLRWVTVEKSTLGQ